RPTAEPSSDGPSRRRRLPPSSREAISARLRERKLVSIHMCPKRPHRAAQRRPCGYISCYPPRTGRGSGDVENTTISTRIGERMGGWYAGGRAACCGGGGTRGGTRATHSRRPPKKCGHSRKLVCSGVALLVAFAAGRAQADLTA